MYFATGVEPTNEIADDVGMLEQRVDRDLVAVHDVEHAVRDAGLVQQLREVDRRRRILLGRLEHERVPARDRRREHPHRHHRREVERRDAADDAERLADRVDVDARRRLLRVAALQQVRDPARELDDLEPARNLAERVGVHLAVLGGEEPCDVVAMLVEQLARTRKRSSARVDERRRAPRRERRLRGGDRALRPLRWTRSRPRRSACPSPGCRPGRCDRSPPHTAIPPIQWLIGLTAVGAS